MNTKNSQGRSIALIAGLYFIAKSVLNLILGGGFLDIIISALEAAVLFTGLMYMNYVVAVVVVLIVLKNLIPNIQNLGSNWIYLIEGIIDFVVAVVLCISPSVREHCSNSPAEIFGDGDN